MAVLLKERSPGTGRSGAAGLPPAHRGARGWPRSLPTEEERAKADARRDPAAVTPSLSGSAHPAAAPQEGQEALAPRPSLGRCRATLTWLRAHLREIVDFPKAGIVFKDITPLLADVDAFRFTVDAMAEAWPRPGSTRRRDRGPRVSPCGAGGLSPRRVADPDPQAGQAPVGDRRGVLRARVRRGPRAGPPDAAAAGNGWWSWTTCWPPGAQRGCLALIEWLGANVAGVHVLLELGFLAGRARLGDRDVRALLVEA